LNNVEIRHKLVVSIQMANKNKELIPLSIPITIESIVADTDVTPPPCHISQSNQAALLHFANKIYPGKSIEDNNQQKSSSSSSSSSTPASSFRRFIRSERRRNTVLVDQSSESTTKAESVEQTTFQIPRRSSSIVRGRRSSNNNSVNVMNMQNSIGTIIESASEYTDESSNDNTIATTVTYTNNTEHERNSHGFPQKGLHKSGNVIAETFNLFRNRGSAKKRISRASSSASTVRFAPGLIEVISMRPNTTNIANINNTSLTT